MLISLYSEYQFARWKPSVLGATAILCAMGFLKILSPDYVVRITQAINAPLVRNGACL